MDDHHPDRPPHDHHASPTRGTPRAPPRPRAVHPPRTRRESAVQVGRLAGEQLAVASRPGRRGRRQPRCSRSIAARLLAPGAFAELAAFLALYLLIHVPAGSLSAGSALSPELAARARRAR